MHDRFRGKTTETLDAIDCNKIKGPSGSFSPSSFRSALTRQTRQLQQENPVEVGSHSGVPGTAGSAELAAPGAADCVQGLPLAARSIQEALQQAVAEPYPGPESILVQAGSEERNPREGEIALGRTRGCRLSRASSTRGCRLHSRGCCRQLGELTGVRRRQSTSAAWKQSSSSLLPSR
jgi:hypothetical protein